MANFIIVAASSGIGTATTALLEKTGHHVFKTARDSSKIVPDAISHNKGIANLRGLVGNLLEADLRAPIGAFPQEYLQDLWGRAVSGVRYPEAENRSSLSRQVLKLFDHWKQMQENGMDPMWIDKDNKQLSWVARDSTQNFYGQMLADMLGEPPADAHGRKPFAKTLKS